MLLLVDVKLVHVKEAMALVSLNALTAEVTSCGDANVYRHGSGSTCFNAALILYDLTAPVKGLAILTVTHLDYGTSSTDELIASSHIEQPSPQPNGVVNVQPWVTASWSPDTICKAA